MPTALSTFDVTALLTLYAHAQRAATLTSDVLAPLYARHRETLDLRRVGNLMRLAKRAGWIEPTPRFRTSTKTNHECPRRVWRSKVRVQ